MANILMVMQPPDGGCFQHVARLSAALARAGHEVTVCGPRPCNDPAAGVEYEVLALERRVSAHRDARCAAHLAEVVRRRRPDLIHAHSSKAGAVARVARAAFPRTPVVYTPHGYAFAGYFESDRKRTAYRLAERMLAPMTSRVLAVCEAERRLAERVVPARRTRAVRNGVPLGPAPEPAPSVASLRNGGPLLGVATLLRPGKGVDTLVDAMARVVRERPETRLAIAAPSGHDGAAVADLIRRRGLESQVKLVGEVPGAGSLAVAVDLVIAPSWAEALPYSLLESMAAGAPVVATSVGGVPEAVVDGETGYLVPPRDERALADAILRALESPAELERLGTAGRRRVEAGFSLEQMLAGTVAVYEELLG